MTYWAHLEVDGAGRDLKETYFAHSANEIGEWHPLSNHLYDVGEQAAVFAEAFGASEEARLAGVLHDLGKYGDLFQKRLQGLERGIDHWSPGAWFALSEYKQAGLASAIAIQGHHTGLQKIDKMSLAGIDPQRLSVHHPLGLRLSEADIAELVNRFKADELLLPSRSKSLYGDSLQETASAMLDVRMLYSVLVDADFLDTERHFKGGRTDGSPLQADKALDVVMKHIVTLGYASSASEAVKLIRSDLFKACLDAGGKQPRLWTLTAPTGAGKTLSMLVFALKHAMQHSLRRVIIVLPYLNIIDQTVSVYREILDPVFGNDYILEHHSMSGTKADAGETDTRNVDESRARLLSENWDAPIIITTNVQLLESLFSNRTSACRKLHRLAKSVILFDEAQTLPVALSLPTLASLSHLTSKYGATVVFSTATQPAFTHLNDKVKKFGKTGWVPKEIVPPELGLFDRVRRSRVNWPDQGRMSWDELTGLLAKSGQALCIVNLRRHAKDIFARLRGYGNDGAFHLSTYMCPAHRKAVLDEVRDRLEKGMPCHLVSTQCVEAGVDIDFPVVFRAFGPLDAVAQAAGRCNRNGKLSAGEVSVFLPEEEKYPLGVYEQAAGVARLLLKEKGAEGMDINNPALFDEYYRLLYDIARQYESSKLAGELAEAIKVQDFVRVADLYSIVSQDTINVLVPYDLARYNTLAEDVRENGLNGHWIRKARPYAVSVFRPKKDSPFWGFVESVPIKGGERSSEWFIYFEQQHYNHYHKDTGFAPPETSEALFA